MAKVLLVNPKTRSRRRNPSAKQTAWRKEFARRARAGSLSSRRRRRNPVTALPAVARALKPRRTSPPRAVNPRRRRRNPTISLPRASAYLSMVKDGLIGGAGAIAVDLAMGQINKFLPTTLQRVPGKVGVGDGVKVILTVLMGKLLSGPTRGLSMKAASGALSVQAHGILAQFLPNTMVLGYSSPARVANMTARVGPNVSRYIPSSTETPLLNRFVPGNAPLLNRAGRSAAREMVMR